MIFVINILPRWTEVLGWTLLHSVWQAALILLLTIFVLRILPLRLSTLRYSIACGSILMIFLSSAATFITLRPGTTEIVSASTSYNIPVSYGPQVSQATESSVSWFSETLTIMLATVDKNMPLILMFWSLGAIVFSMRLISGWWYISRLKSKSEILTDEWNVQLQHLAQKIGIGKFIALAESKRITTPMVIGFFKPLILVPTGMLAGLTPAQVETIFLHELAHIRRHDYIINLVQVVVETFFFFNPFVWIISNIIRREREYCCDDEVISVHGNSITYANALAQLEELKLTRSTFALALAANKNQLFNRIKRIMEKTGQKYSVKDRFVPAVLLIVGLVCASWLTVQNNQNSARENSFAQDTTIKKGSSSKTTIITFDENGDAHEQIFEQTDGDDTDAFAWATAPVAAFPAHPSFPAFPPMPVAPSFPVFPAMPADVWRGGIFSDTIPGAGFRQQNWEEFSEEFEKEFSEKFSDFYKNHEEDFDKMMKEMEEKFKSDFEHQGFRELESLNHLNLGSLAQLESLKALEHLNLAELDMEHAQTMAKLAEVSALQVGPDLEALTSQLAGLQGELDAMDGQMKNFEKDLQKMLISDGYLKQGDEIKNIKWDDDSIEVNGKKIKASDHDRYQKIHNKYFKGNLFLNRVE
jgi:beta-lactamase regulating signal transducer with metallopeptidase domain